MTRAHLTLVAGCLVTLTLGSIHAFSVFLLPLETTYGASRSSVSLVYSLALVSLTVAVLFGHRIYPLLSAPRLVALACGGAALGLVIAGSARTMLTLYLGYGLAFGAANGLGYGFVLQLVAQAMPGAAGFAMGTVTAVYAIGAVVFARVLSDLLAAYSTAVTMQVMAAVLAATALLAGAMLVLARAAYSSRDRAAREAPRPGANGLILRLWIGYGTAVAAGLMVIGHAAGIIMNRGGNTEMMVVATMMIGAGNALGGVAGGFAADRMTPRVVLGVLPFVSTAVLFVLLLAATADLSAWCLAVVGLCYGAIIAVYPAAVLALFGTHDSARVYGLVFTSWGLAGLMLPWLAGAMFDRSGAYDLPILVAAGLGLVAMAAGFSLPAQARRG